MMMEVDYRKAMRHELPGLSRSFDEALKELCAELELVEQELVLTGIGKMIEAEGTVLLDREVDRDSGAVVFGARLAYASHQGKRRILVRSYTADDPETGIEDVNGTDQPLLESPPDQRVKAVTSGALDELFGLVQRRAEELLRDTLEATRRLREATVIPSHDGKVAP
jgi:hypothetical protein